MWYCTDADPDHQVEVNQHQSHKCYGQKPNVAAIEPGERDGREIVATAKEAQNAVTDNGRDLGNPGADGGRPISLLVPRV